MTIGSPQTASSSSSIVEGRRAAQREKQRKRLLDAANLTFQEMGYADSTVADILKTAGMSRRSFYELFTGKDNIFAALASDVAKQLQDAIATSQSIESLLLALTRIVRERRSVFRRVAENPASHSDLGSALRAFDDAIVTIATSASGGTGAVADGATRQILLYGLISIATFRDSNDLGGAIARVAALLT